MSQLLPVVVSPWLRPFRRHGEMVVDDAVSGRVWALSESELAVLAAMWPGSAASAFSEVVRGRGEAEVAAALAGLADKGLLYESLGEAEAALDGALAGGFQAVPFVDQIELTNVCPMKCGFCPRGVDGKMRRPTGFMERELFVRLLAQLHPGQAQYRPLELHHLGESLLHGDLVEFVGLASERGLPTELSVNPSHLRPEIMRGLLAAGVGRLVVSLDGMDGETLAQIRGPAAKYEKAERHLEALLEEAGKCAKPPQIVIQMIDLQANRGQREAFRERWGRTGLPFVQAYVKDLDGPDPATGKASGEPLQFLCSYPWRSVVVLWDGRVVPCCRDDDARVVLGDLRRESLAGIWQGRAARELREGLRRKTLPAGHLCEGCSWRREAFVSEDALRRRHPARAKEWPLGW